MSSTSGLKSSDCNSWPPLSADEIETKVKGLPLWIVEGKAPPILQREFKTKNFSTALEYINHAGAVCEERGHHANFHLTGWNTVKVEIYSHGTNSLTENDFNLAVAMDKGFSIAYSKKWLKENPESQKLIEAAQEAKEV